jgi:hypothetical protein
VSQNHLLALVAGRFFTIFNIKPSILMPFLILVLHSANEEFWRPKIYHRETAKTAKGANDMYEQVKVERTSDAASFLISGTDSLWPHYGGIIFSSRAKNARNRKLTKQTNDPARSARVSISTESIRIPAVPCLATFLFYSPTLIPVFPSYQRDQASDRECSSLGMCLRRFCILGGGRASTAPAGVETAARRHRLSTDQYTASAGCLKG